MATSAGASISPSSLLEFLHSYLKDHISCDSFFILHHFYTHPTSQASSECDPYDAHLEGMQTEQDNYNRIVGALKSLEVSQKVEVKLVDRTFWYLTREGCRYATSGTPESMFLAAILRGESMTKEKKADGEGKAKPSKKGEPTVYELGQKEAMKNKWILQNPTTKQFELSCPVTHTLLRQTPSSGAAPPSPPLPSLTPDSVAKLSALQDPPVNTEVPFVFDLAQEYLKAIQWSSRHCCTVVGEEEWLVRDCLLAQRERCNLMREQIERLVEETMGCKVHSEEDPHSILEEFKRRKWVEVRHLKAMEVSKGPFFDEGLTTGGPEGARRVNFFAEGKRPTRGSIHPLECIRRRFEDVLKGMGFEEMRTDQWVECSFWNFDALFQPQQHPARDAHDTFFMKTPSSTSVERLPNDYVERVKAAHETGGDGSIGYRYNWSVKECEKNILRTHTTAVSARMLYAMGEDYKKTGIVTPRRYFSIDRVFRNETLDATHLAEFHQVEGVVADRGLTVWHLKAILREFYCQIGIVDLRFKPAYNPYTEPSMEVFGYHEALDKWMEVGNSGLFRPEMLRPMGLPKDLRVMAWGLSLERPTMIKYEVSNIRELFGHKARLAKCR
eukprot:GHVS01088784.1.p1 GENE.GHVS01088784.1~~GHVS01088784.1.p1  ORF type:complete len:629 (-),score=51.75 GHVS01088784.1:206-2041(-)